MRQRILPLMRENRQYLLSAKRFMRSSNIYYVTRPLISTSLWQENGENQRNYWPHILRLRLHADDQLIIDVGVLDVTFYTQKVAILSATREIWNCKSRTILGFVLYVFSKKYCGYDSHACTYSSSAYCMLLSEILWRVKALDVSIRAPGSLSPILRHTGKCTISLQLINKLKKIG